MKAIEKIDKYTSNQSFDEFCKNDLVIDAVIRNFEVIEGAARKVAEKVKRQFPFVEWKEAVGLQKCFDT